MTRPSLGHLPFTQGPTTSQLDPPGYAGPKASGRLASGLRPTVISCSSVVLGVLSTSGDCLHEDDELLSESIGYS